ncbi:MAG: methionine--tRNA ligase [Caldilineaceae bacterium]
MKHPVNNRAAILYLTTSIPYVNAQPHIGHALEFVQGDVLARYYRQRSVDVRYQSGADENSLKNVQAAEREGIPVQDLVARNAARFSEAGEVLGASFDDFIRTSSEPRHVAGVYRLWQACVERGDIYKRPYHGLYCVGCETFYDESELIDGRCPIHETVPEIVEEENYFFRLSHYAAELEQLIETDQLRIVPEARKNEVLAFIRRGLHDFSISRSQARAHGWGIPVPGDVSQVIYVWFDALTNYISALEYGNPDEQSCYQQYWVEADQRIHLIGKDITRFHAIYWPAMLLSAGVPLPTSIFVHGFLTINGRKISKSLGNVVDPLQLITSYGVDGVRYYLLRKIPATQDGDFSEPEFVRTYNADLADQLGNLVSRVLKMIIQYCDGKVPVPTQYTAVDQELIDLIANVQPQIELELRQFALHKALTLVWSVIEAANKYVVTTEPWIVARQLKAQPDNINLQQRLDTILFVLAETLHLIAVLLRPFLPKIAATILNQLGLREDAEWNDPSCWSESLVGVEVRSGGVLFPKLTT